MGCDEEMNEPTSDNAATLTHRVSYYVENRKHIYEPLAALRSRRQKSTTTSTVVFYRTRVYQMQPQNGQNWHFSVGKYVHHNRETAKIGICTPLKLYVYFRFASETTGI